MNINRITSGYIFMMLISGLIAQKTEPHSIGNTTTTYVAAVVEYYPTSVGATADEQLAQRAADYVALIGEAAAASADIVVFPEFTLTITRQQAQLVPDPVDRIVPCDHRATTYATNPLGRISCAARDHRIYVVINLTMRRPCDAVLNGLAACTEEWSLYNTNVVLDRTGAVISIYRKTHLFDEKGIQTTAVPDLSTFETDFGVVFGHFICFDLLFRVPANVLMRRGVRNFVYPTKWFDQLPFMSAVQVQQGWAFSYDVNLLAAGSNEPNIGSSGTGIYAGRAGALRSFITGRLESRLLVAEISKQPPANPIAAYEGPSSDVPLAESVSDLFHSHDKTAYRYERLAVGQAGGNGNVKYEMDGHECGLRYTLDLVDEAFANEAVSYTYFMVIYNGIKSYGGFAEVRVRLCAVVACTDEADVASCGKIFPSTATVQNRFKFSQLEISGTFASTLNYANLTMPTTLTKHMLPLRSNAFTYTELIDENHTNVTMRLTKENADLLTFGVYSAMDVDGAADL